MQRVAQVALTPHQHIQQQTAAAMAAPASKLQRASTGMLLVATLYMCMSCFATASAAFGPDMDQTAAALQPQALLQQQLGGRRGLQSWYVSESSASVETGVQKQSPIKSKTEVTYTHEKKEEPAAEEEEAPAEEEAAEDEGAEEDNKSKNIEFEYSHTKTIEKNIPKQEVIVKEKPALEVAVAVDHGAHSLLDHSGAATAGQEVEVEVSKEVTKDAEASNGASP